MRKEKFLFYISFIIIIILESFLFYKLHYSSGTIDTSLQGTEYGDRVIWLFPFTCSDSYFEYTNCFVIDDPLQGKFIHDLKLIPDFVQIALLCLFVLFKQNIFWYRGKFRFVRNFDTTQRLAYKNYCTKGKVERYKFIIIFRVIEFLILLFFIWQVLSNNGGIFLTVLGHLVL